MSPAAGVIRRGAGGRRCPIWGSRLAPVTLDLHWRSLFTRKLERLALEIRSRLGRTAEHPQSGGQTIRDCARRVRLSYPSAPAPRSVLLSWRRGARPLWADGPKQSLLGKGEH